MKTVLLDYFNYLRDTSKNLITSGDGYRCLIPKYTKKVKNDVSEVGASFLNKKILLKADKDSKTIVSYINQIKKETNKKCFFGVGYVVGNLNKRIFGSVVNIPIAFNSEEFKEGSIDILFDYENTTLNYDLISSLLPDYFSSELDETANDILNLLTETEQNLKLSKNLEYIQEQIHNLFSKLRKANKNINIQLLEETISYENLIDHKRTDSLINKRDLFYRADKYHTFIQEIPDAISTWENLKVFCEDIQSNSFESSVLKEFFSNVFSLDYAKNKALDSIDYVDFIREFVPIDVSPKQVTAINNCFNSNISYIQGPPGTGKSHTISSILLSSILSGKKTLLVSQKPQALEVVKSKIGDFFDEEINVPFIYFSKENKVDLKNDLLELSNRELPKDVDINHYHNQLSSLRAKLKKYFDILKDKQFLLEAAITSYASFFNQNETFKRKIDIFFDNPMYEAEMKHKLVPLKTENENFVSFIKNAEAKYIEFECVTKYDELLIKRYQKKFNDFFETNVDFMYFFKNKILTPYLDSWFSLLHDYGKNEKIKSKLANSDLVKSINYDIESINKEIMLVKKSIFSLFHKKKMYESIRDPILNSEVQRFAKMLHWSRGDVVLEKMNKISYSKLLDIYPVWMSEIRNIGEILPNNSEMFDLVIVDEASQVNLAEILPIFYRAKKICIVGDHKQLGLNASGLTFNLSKKFDKIIWNKYKPNGIDFDMANLMNLTITKASILDLLRSEENKETFKYVMLDEHYRSLPGLTAFNNKEFYGNELKIMTEIPTKTLVKCFSAIKVPGEKESKINKLEAKEVVNAIKFIIGKKLPKDIFDKYQEEIQLNKFVPKLPTIGIISAVRDQVDYIKELLEEFSEEELQNHRIICGTPEEFQGDEFDIVIMSTTTDESSKNNGHYNNSNRFNVASSRARFYTVFIYSDVSRIPMYESYLNHFGIFGQRQRDPSNILNWDYDLSNKEHQFVKKIDEVLREILESIEGNENLRFFSDVNSCGQKIKFVIYNVKNEKFIAIDPIGILDENQIEQMYGKKVLSKISILSKAGWKVITPTYHSWFSLGKIKNNKEEAEKLRKEILNYLI